MTHRDDTGDRVIERIHARGTWTAESALHVSGEKEAIENNVDMVLQRDDAGEFFIAGASIAGAARSALAHKLLAYDQFIATDPEENDRPYEPPELRALFGDDYASALTVFDAKAKTQPGVLVRDGVKIDLNTGIAEDRKKYNFEILPPGTEFDMEFSLLVYEKSPLVDTTRDRVLAVFRAMLEAFSGGEIRLGARTRRGLGHGRVVGGWRIHRLDMGDREHVLAWLKRTWEQDVEASPLDALPQLEAAIEHRRFEIAASLRLKTSLLIRSAGNQPNDPDNTHLTELGHPMLTGTSLTGALRSRCERIWNTCRRDDKDELIKEMFGFAPEQRDREGVTELPRASRVCVSESSLEHGEACVHTRVTIDRFTGGAVESRLFDEAPLWPKDTGPHARIRIHLEEPDDSHVGLLLLAFKDLWLGDLPLGGESGIGRGVFEGVEATFHHPDWGDLTLTADLQDPARVKRSGDEAGWAALDAMVASLTKQEAAHG